MRSHNEATEADALDERDGVLSRRGKTEDWEVLENGLMG